VGKNAGNMPAGKKAIGGPSTEERGSKKGFGGTGGGTTRNTEGFERRLLKTGSVSKKVPKTSSGYGV